MKFKFVLLFWICTALAATATQYGTSIVDSCVRVDDVSDSSFFRTLYIFTDTGNFIESDIRFSQSDPWTVSYIYPLSLNREQSILDSLGRITESVKYLRVVDSWQLSERRLYTYDAFGNCTDSIFQVVLAFTAVSQ